MLAILAGGAARGNCRRGVALPDPRRSRGCAGGPRGAPYPEVIESRIAGDVPGDATGRGPAFLLRSLSSRRAPGPLRRARTGLVAYFAVLGLSNGVWLARIPAIKQHLHLSDGLLGVALLAAPAGLVVVVQIAGKVMHTFGSRRPTVIAGVVVPLLPVVMGLAGSLATLMAGLFAFGFAGGMLDVGMNSQAVEVQRRYGRPLMTSFHACFSFGALVGALFGGLFAWAGIGPALNFLAAGVPLSVLAVLASRWLVTEQPAAEQFAAAQPAAAQPAAAQPAAAQGESATVAARPADARGEPESRPESGRSRRSLLPGSPRSLMQGSRWSVALLMMGLLALCSLLSEGSADGWSAVYMRDNLHTSAGLAALGYAGFSVAMALGRLAGDDLAARFGAAVLMRACGLLGAVGMATVLLTGSAVGALVGFVVFGLGLSSTFPLLLSAAGSADPQRPSSAIAKVAGFGYAGMLGGPVLIGGLASALGLPAALAVPAVLALVITAGAGIVRPAAAAAGGSPR
jgi:MFS family permease